MSSLAERNALWLQAHYDEGFLSLPETIQAEPESDRPSWTAWYIVCALCVLFGAVLGGLIVAVVR